MVQIAFLTLFLGLVLGPQPIELTVTGPVAAVELRLDGAPAGLIVGPPWTGQIDFGPALLPHELVARALDEQGQEIGRVQQWVNLSRPPAEVDILLEDGPAGRPVAARLTWQSVEGESPSAIRVTFDDKPLVVEPGGGVKLPAWDPETSHVLTAELRFSGALVARRDVVFGGRWGEEISTELTAVPVRLRPGKELPSPERMEGWFRAAGRPMHVAAVEESPAELLVVRDLAVRNELGKLVAGGSRARPSIGIRGGAALLDQRSSDYRRFHMTLSKEDAVRFIWPVPRPVAARGTQLFEATRGFDARDGGLLWFLARFAPLEDDPSRQRLADAVAVAGLQALHANHRRAVLLVLSEKAMDRSPSDPSLVRRYLESIRVPLFVWTLADPASPAAAAWGDAEKVSSVGRMRKAFNRLKADLDSQHIVWIEGRHLPQSIEISGEAAVVLELVR